MPEYAPRVSPPERVVDDLNVPAMRRDVLEVIARVAESSGDPVVRAVCSQIWEEFTVIWRHGKPSPPEIPTWDNLGIKNA